MISRVSCLCSIFAALQFAATNVAADPGAALACPPIGFLDTINLAQNPSFEMIGSNGNPSICPAPCVSSVVSAAAAWTIHSSNQGDAISTRVEPLTALAPRLVPYGTAPPEGTQMLHVIAGGNEGGVFQNLAAPPAKMMFQVWVYVRSGKVAIQPHGTNVGPTAWSSKLNQWEELRVCTDGTVPTNSLVIYNEAPAGGEFWVDRAEARAIP